MADISNEIKIFREAVYGKEVRGGMISLAEKMNEVSENTETAEKKRVTAETKRVNAEKKREESTAQAVQNCDSAIGRADSAAKRADDAAESIAGAVSGVINDRKVSETTTYSSEKIEEIAQVNRITEAMLMDTLPSNAEGSYENGKLIVTSTTITDRLAGLAYVFVDVKQNTTYSICWKSTRTGNTGGGIVIKNKDNTNIFTGAINDLNGKIIFNSGLNEQIRVAFAATERTSLGGAAGDSAEFWDVMLVEGEAVAPYMDNIKDVVKEVARTHEDYLPIDVSGYKNLYAGDDLNECQMKGVYKATSGVVSKEIKNIPPGLNAGFLMFVIEITGTTYTRQILIENGTNKLFTRSYANGVYETWSRLVDNQEFDEMNQRFELVNEGDILDIKKSGIYFIGSSVTGKPQEADGTNGCLIVSYGTESNKVYQYVGSPNGTTYIKRFYGSTKDNGWKKVLSETEIVNDFTTADPKKVAAAPLVKKLKEDMEVLDARVSLINKGTFEDITKAGIYYVANGVTGKPTETGGMYIVASPYNDGKTQVGLYVPNNNTRPYVVYCAAGVIKTYQL